MESQLKTFYCGKTKKQFIPYYMYKVSFRSAAALFSLVTIFAGPALADQATAKRHAEKAQKYQDLGTLANDKGDIELVCHYTFLTYEEYLKAVRTSDDGLIPGLGSLTTYFLKTEKDIIGSCRRMGHL